MSWTDERVALLTKLWADGLSASQIAAELGGITRNAVIGKVHRLGLSGRAKSPSSSSPRPRKARSSGMMRVSRSSMRGNTALAYDYEVEPEPELIEIPLEQRKTLLQLTEKTCHWPIGDPGSTEFFFCGGDTAERSALLHLPLARRLSAGVSDRRRDKRPFRGCGFNRRAVVPDLRHHVIPRPPLPAPHLEMLDQTPLGMGRDAHMISAPGRAGISF